MKRIVCLAYISFFLLTGCRTTDPEAGRPLSVTVPADYSAGTGPLKTDRMWYKSFKSEELNRLIADALENNFDVKSVRARLAQARAALKKQTASTLPGLDYSFGGLRRATRVKKSHSSSSVSDGSHSWDTSFTGSWTPDIWGDDRAATASEQKTVEAAKLDIEFTQWELAARIAELWIDIIATRKKIDILQKQIEGNQRQLELLELRFANGKADALDVSQQREALAEARSQKPLLKRQEKIFHHTLMFLSGKSSPGDIAIETIRLPGSFLSASPGIPSDLLANRPDIRAARQRLISSQWDVETARVDLLPSLKLTANALFSSGNLDLLFHNWVATLTAAVTGPIFDGGFKRAEVDRLKAVAQEQLNAYARTVAGAIREVEDSLVTIRTQDDFIGLLEEELVFARLTLNDALLQYWNGKGSYLAYFVVLTRVERLERQLIGEKAAVIKERIKLYQVLGFAPISNDNPNYQVEQN